MNARVVICLDGSDPAYFEDALAVGIMPALARWRREGTWSIGQAVVPTFTNPNNVSIVCGVPPRVHGISGNHFLDVERGVEVPMNERGYVRAPSILDRLAAGGSRVLAVTAKDKLTKLIRPAAATGSAFSAEKPGELGRALLPSAGPVDVYSAEASLFVLDAGIAAIERGVADFLYLSTTDYVQHKHAPGLAEARAFYAAIDRRLARFDALGAIVGLTADHGMNDKTRPDGSPNVVYLGDLIRGARVTLPITDPYVVHHGALGGCAMIYLSDRTEITSARKQLAETPGVERVLEREEAAARFELPADRIGDLVVLAGKTAVLGKTPREHDLSHVAKGLRSHGSLHERDVPIVLNVRAERQDAPRWNYELIETVLSSA